MSVWLSRCPYRAPRSALGRVEVLEMQSSFAAQGLTLPSCLTLTRCTQPTPRAAPLLCAGCLWPYLCPDPLFHCSKLLKWSSWRAAGTGPSGDFFFSIRAVFQHGKYSICFSVTSVKPSCPLNAPNTPSPIYPILHCLPSICH